MSLSPGDLIGRYEILGPIGAGGMGEIYRARDSDLGREVAVKVLPSELSDSPERQKRFEREARAAAALNHPNLLTVYDVGLDDGTPYLVTELLEGETLRQVLLEGPCVPKSAVEWALATTRGLAAAHSKGIVHRDLKPDNIFLIADGGLRILDFGLAKIIAPENDDTTVDTVTDDTEAGRVLGTFGYMAPEQLFRIFPRPSPEPVVRIIAPFPSPPHAADRRSSHQACQLAGSMHAGHSIRVPE